MIDFQIKGGRLVIDPHTLTVKAFYDIWEHDKTTSKAKASNLLLYVFHICDITQKNPFKDLPESDKDIIARHNAFGSKTYKFGSVERDLVDSAIEWYNVLNKDSIQRLSLGINRKIDQVTNFIMDPANDIINAKQLDDQSEMLIRIEKVLGAKKKTDEYVRQELEKSKTRGNNARSPLQKGLV